MEATAAELRIIALLEQLVATTQPRPDLMTASDVARELRIGVRTLQRLRQLGEVPEPIVIGGQIRWRRSDLEQFLLEAPR